MPQTRATTPINSSIGLPEVKKEMIAMMQTGLFDWQRRVEQLDNGGVPWELFRKDLETIRAKERLSPAGTRS